MNNIAARRLLGQLSLANANMPCKDCHLLYGFIWRSGIYIMRSKRRNFVVLGLALLATAFVTAPSAEARCNNLWDCNKRGAGRIFEGGKKTIRQARTDFSNGLNRIDPRITKVGRDFDRMRREFLTNVYTGPALERWLVESRNRSYPNAAPIYPQMREALRGWYSEDLLRKVRFKVGDNGDLNLANNTLRFNQSVYAVTLIDVIIFRGPEEAANPALWAHEMKHVQQFAQWGVRKFAIRYMRSWNSVENEAYDVERRFAASYRARLQTAAASTATAKLTVRQRPPRVFRGR